MTKRSDLKRLKQKERDLLSERHQIYIDGNYRRASENSFDLSDVKKAIKKKSKKPTKPKY